LCLARVRRLCERLGELIELDVVGVLLRGVRARMAHRRLKRDNIAAALAEEPVRKTVTKLMRGETSNAGAPAYTPHHPHQSLVTCRLFRVLASTHPGRRRYPLLNFDREKAVVELRLNRRIARSKLRQDVGSDRKPLPVLAFAMNSDAASNKIDIYPAAMDDLGAPKAGTLHEDDCRPLVEPSSLSQSCELIKARPIDVGLPLRWTLDLP
jgi:hypothetical protein